MTTLLIYPAVDVACCTLYPGVTQHMHHDAVMTVVATLGTFVPADWLKSAHDGTLLGTHIPLLGRHEAGVDTILTAPAPGMGEGTWRGGAAGHYASQWVISTLARCGAWCCDGDCIVELETNIRKVSQSWRRRPLLEPLRHYFNHPGCLLWCLPET